MAEQAALHLRLGGERGKDIFLCHTGADKPWVERLAERIEAEPYQNRFLGVVFDKWDFEKGGQVESNDVRPPRNTQALSATGTRREHATKRPQQLVSASGRAPPSGNFSSV